MWTEIALHGASLAAAGIIGVVVTYISCRRHCDHCHHVETTHPGA